MKRFSPPYKTLVRIKTLQEKGARHKVAHTAFHITRLMEEKTENEQEMAVYQEGLSRIERLFLEQLCIKNTVLEEKISLLHKSMVMRQKELRVATLSRKMIEKIQQKHYHFWKKRLHGPHGTD